VFRVPPADNPTTVDRGHYIGLRWALSRDGWYPFSVKETTPNGGGFNSFGPMRFPVNRWASTDQAPGLKRARFWSVHVGDYCRLKRQDDSRTPGALRANAEKSRGMT
jgi:hypothetical protein